MRPSLTKTSNDKVAQCQSSLPASNTLPSCYGSLPTSPSPSPPPQDPPSPEIHGFHYHRFMCCSVSGWQTSEPMFSLMLCCWNLMESHPQQQGHFPTWVQPASERAATRLESGNLTTCSRFRLPRQDHLDDPTEIWKALTWLCDPHQNSDPLF